MTGEFLHVYRFSPQTDGETAIPCALLAKRHIPGKDGYPHQPEKGQWLWRDRDPQRASPFYVHRKLAFRKHSPHL